MIASNTDCLSDTELRDFVSGRLPNDRFANLLAHIDVCQACQDRAESSAELNDSFATALAAPTDADCPIISEIDCQAALFHAANVGANRFDSLLPPIETLGPYRLLRPIGRGGMGEVYLAEHTRLRKKCAIKLLPRERGFDADWRGRFEREMQAVASLNHPNIVTATDAGDVDGWHFLVMECLDGLDLATISRRCGPLPIDAAAAIGREICRALAVVHDAGLIHRDVKPSNVMLTSDGTVKLLDLGLVLVDQGSPDDMRLTTVGHMIGTLAYAAPEQLTADQTIDARTDLYGLGALIAGFVFYVQTDRGTLVIESEIDGLQIAISQETESVDGLQLAQGENRTTLRSGNYSIALDTESDNAIISDSQVVVRRGEQTIVKVRRKHGESIAGSSGGEKQFKGKPLSHYLNMLETERDIDTLGNAMIAIASLADADDVQVAPAMLVSARKHGGWSAGNQAPHNDYPSENFMQNLYMAYRRLMPQAGIAAIIDELRVGNTRSRAACLFQLNIFEHWQLDTSITIGSPDDQTNRLTKWAAAESNQVLATELHDVLRQLLAGPLLDDPPPDNGEWKHSEFSEFNCRDLSLRLALALERSLADEPELEPFLHERIAAAVAATQTHEERLRILTDTLDEMIGTWGLGLTSEQIVAAYRLGLDVPPPVAVLALLFGGDSYRQQRNALFMQLLETDRQDFSDLALVSIATWQEPPFYLLGTNEEFWKPLLPIIAKHTSAPELAVRALVYFDRDMSQRYSMVHGRSRQEIYSDSLRQAALDAVRTAEERLFDDLETVDSLPKIVSDELRKQAAPSSGGGLSAFALGRGANRAPSKPNLAADWNQDGKVSLAETAWYQQKEEWKSQWVGQTKAANLGGFGGGGVF